MIVVNIMQNLLSGLATETERRRAMKRIIRLRGWDNEYMPGAHPGLPEGHAHKGKRGKLRPRPGSAPEETEQIVKCIAGSNLPIYWPAFWYRIARHLNAPHNLLTHVRSSETPDVLAMLYTALAFTLFVVMSRILAETGLFFLEPRWYPCAFLVVIFGIRAVGPTTALLLIQVLELQRSGLRMVWPSEVDMPALKSRIQMYVILILMKQSSAETLVYSMLILTIHIML